LRVQRRNADEQQKDNSFSEQVAAAHPEAQTVGLLLITTPVTLFQSRRTTAEWLGFNPVDRLWARRP